MPVCLRGVLICKSASKSVSLNWKLTMPTAYARGTGQFMKYEPAEVEHVCE